MKSSLNFIPWDQRIHGYICQHWLKPRQSGRQFADDIFECNFLNENIWIPIKFSLLFVPYGLINNIPALVQIMAWRLSGYKPLFEPMMPSSPTHICVTRPQWVNIQVQECRCKTYIFRWTPTFLSINVGYIPRSPFSSVSCTHIVYRRSLVTFYYHSTVSTRAQVMVLYCMMPPNSKVQWHSSHIRTISHCVTNNL